MVSSLHCQVWVVQFPVGEKSVPTKGVPVKAQKRGDLKQPKKLQEVKNLRQFKTVEEVKALQIGRKLDL
jgi:hypothetical protein